MFLVLKNGRKVRELTYQSIRNERLVVEAKDFGDIIEVRMLSDESPLGVVHPVVEVGYANLNAPVVLVVNLDMPMHPNWAHMMSAMK